MKQQPSKKIQQHWIPTPQKLNLNPKPPFIRAVPMQALPDNKIIYSLSTDGTKHSVTIDRSAAFQTSRQLSTFDDMCKMTILNEPQVLHNLVERYKKDRIFTFIGPTLIVVNPYRLISSLFSPEVMEVCRKDILGLSNSNNYNNNNNQNNNQSKNNSKNKSKNQQQDLNSKQKNRRQIQKPHVYYVAGLAYQAMRDYGSKEAIVISGESGAGKTESAKYCMAMLTALSQNSDHCIEQKILACNSLLQAFGNSKTVRNDNSSRFGKYIQIFFSQQTNTITGASIQSYLLQKSRVVSISQSQRSFHIFYALAASKQHECKSAQSYAYLKQSNTTTASGIDDQLYYKEIRNSMKSIGFTQKQQYTIWALLVSVLELGNVEFDDTMYQINQNNACQITGGDLKKIGKGLGIGVGDLEKVLVVEKKKFLKEFTFSSYSKNSCVANRNTLSKAIYNSIFQFIFHKIQKSLRPTNYKSYNCINILDIFGFQNFQTNTFEQLCINFTNQKLLKLYNRYIFEREMDILKQDGLEHSISSIQPPTNDTIITLISGKLSLFSIINDITIPKQYTDQDMMSGFKNIKVKDNKLRFNNIDSNAFVIQHSQCHVSYDVRGFKLKNQDKVIPVIQDIVGRLFSHQRKEQTGKTLLNKFSKEIDDLIQQLNSSNVHFIRCIKPNQTKKPQQPHQTYMLTQIRYLGVFQTIQIRQKTFPSRKMYKQFVNKYAILFQEISKKKCDRKITEQILKLSKRSENQYLFGNNRVYLNLQTEQVLNQKLFKLLKIKNQKAFIIQKALRKVMFRKNVLRNLTILVRRIQVWRRIQVKYRKKIVKSAFNATVETAKQKYSKILKKNKLLQQLKQQRQYNEKSSKHKQMTENIPRLTQLLSNLLIHKSIQPSFGLLKNNIAMVRKGESNSIADSSQNMNLDFSMAELNQTILVEDSVIQNSSKFNFIQKSEQPKNQQKTFKFTEQFLSDSSLYIPQKSQTLFADNIKIESYIHSKDCLKRLCENLEQLDCDADNDEPSIYYDANDEYDQADEDDKTILSFNSKDNSFKISDTTEQMMNKIINFPTQNFFNTVLRKRTSFIGIRKNYVDILQIKKKPLHSSLTIVSQKNQSRVLKAFSLLIRIAEESNFEYRCKYIDNLIHLCQGTQSQIKNQIFIQMIKQSNTKYKTWAISIYQTMFVFLHIYSPSSDYLIAALSIILNRIKQPDKTVKQLQYLLYLFARIIKKLQNPILVQFKPIQYQIIALIMRKQITLAVYLSTGKSVLVKVQSYESFGDIKQKAIQQLGINSKRLSSQLFSFFQIVNYQCQQLEQSPIKEEQNVWDVISYWQLARNKLQGEDNKDELSFFLMLKVKYIFECEKGDIETIQIYFSQCYFDYFIGRIRLNVDQMGCLAACIKLIKGQTGSCKDIIGNYPVWIIKKVKNFILQKALQQNNKYFVDKKFTLYDLKYRFLEICNQCKLAMAVYIPTSSVQKLFLKPKKIIIVENNMPVFQYSMRSVVSWESNDTVFKFSIKQTNSEELILYQIQTEFGNFCCSYIKDVSKLILNRNNMTNILKQN